MEDEEKEVLELFDKEWQNILPDELTLIGAARAGWMAAFKVLRAQLEAEKAARVKVENDSALYVVAIASLQQQRDKLQAALETISAWDLLNPPATNVVADAMWLRHIVDDALCRKP